MSERKTREYRMKMVFDQAGLRSREALCVQDEPPECSAACPVHLDGRALCAAAAEGDFAKGRSVIEKVTVFANILAYGCEAPCVSRCKLSEIGDGVRLNRIEQACLENAQPQPKRRLPMKKKNKTAAIYGSDLFCFALAAELEKKAYDITMYCQAGSLNEAFAGQFPAVSNESILSDLNAFESLGINVVFNTVTDLSAAAACGADVTACSQEILGEASSDPETMYVSEYGMFSGSRNSNIIQSLCEAKIAAASIDRYIQNVPLDQDRNKERSFETKLYTSLKGIEPSISFYADGGSSDSAAAVSEAERCIQCECLECVKGCAYLQNYKKYPKQIIREIYNNLSIVMGNHMANGLINSCALCGQCKAVCPNDFDLPEVCLLARQTMTETKKMPPSTHEFALDDMKFSMSDEYFMFRHQTGRQSSRYVFFPGCQMGAVLPETLKKTYADLSLRLEGGVGLMLGCCGAMAFWGGRTDLFDQTIQKITDSHRQLGSPLIITACPTCFKMIKMFLPEYTVGIWDILNEAGFEAAGLAEKTVFIHDACGARGDSEVQQSVREIVRRLGITAEETEYSEDLALCCGFGGLQSFADRETAQKMAQFCTAQSSADALTYCVNCRDRFIREGKNSRYLLEFIYGAEDSQVLTLSRRRANRIKVKRELLKDHWGEDIMEKSYDFSLEIPEHVSALMEDRMILDEDIYGVIESVRAGASVVREKSTGMNIARHQSGSTTFWIKYACERDVYRIDSVYSHRMQISEV